MPPSPLYVAVIKFVPEPPAMVNAAILPESGAVPRTTEPHMKVTVPVRKTAPDDTVAVKEIGTPSPAGLTELVKVVVLLLMVTGTIELPVGTAAPSVTFVAVKVILPTELLVTVKVIRP